MLMNATHPASSATRPTAATKTIMIVNGGDTAMHLLDAVLEAGRYDIVFVESIAHAYSQIKRVQPNLVVLCTGFEKLDGFQVLSMLKLDEETRGIPVLTYATELEEGDADEDEETGESVLQAAVSALGRMN
jgi:CheY-like chemotaxis protein